MTDQLFTERWYPLKPVAPHRKLLASLMKRRFVIACAGRRSGKSERIKRDGVAESITFDAFGDGRFIFGAPTQQQAKDIFWEDLKAMVPDWALLGSRRDSIYESQPQTIKLYNGASIIVAGLDKPRRIEGSPIDWICLDEYADMKPEVWQESILPAISTPGRPGKARFIGKPRGRNHYYKMVQRAKRDRSGLWAYHNWPSHAVLTPEEIQVLSENMDEQTFDQEINANFVNFEGRAYYAYDEAIHVFPVEYIPGLDLVLNFDFNQAPGTATICQEQEPTNAMRKHLAKMGCTVNPKTVTCILDEIWIPTNSNTRRVGQQLVEEWGGHQGAVRMYGDPSGGARTSSAVMGTDWDLLLEIFRPVWGHNINEAWPRKAPPVRARINATNARLRTAHNQVSLLVHPQCTYTRMDFEGVTLIKGTGEIDKKEDEDLTHLTDGVGYMIEERFPIGGRMGVWQP